MRSSRIAGATLIAAVLITLPSLLDCTAFGAAGSTNGGDGDASFDVLVASEGGVANDGPLPPPPGDGGPAGCTGDWAFCDDFEGVPFPAAKWTPLQAGTGLVAREVDSSRSGQVFQALMGPTSNGSDRALLEAYLPVKDPFVFALSFRAASSATIFAPTAYVAVASFYCGTNRAFGLLFDGRGFTFQFDNDNGDIVGFAKDNAWHSLRVSVASVGSEVVIDDKRSSFPVRTFPPDRKSCRLNVGIYPGQGETIPSVVMRFDDVRGKW